MERQEEEERDEEEEKKEGKEEEEELEKGEERKEKVVFWTSPARLDICQNIYTTGVWGKNFTH